GIIAFNTPVDAATAEAVSGQFVEVLMAPAYTADALKLLAAKANVRVLEIPLDGVDPKGATAWARGRNSHDVKRVGSGLLIQTADEPESLEGRLKVVTKRAPTAQEMTDLTFAWRVAM
ncbi:bifunctional phosphoribosylaminoimidazolecarboxamide formyltransferase/IMP cyclohydrolase, partial [Acinetobacter baumannii]